jgi:hypothetical protein
VPVGTVAHCVLKCCDDPNDGFTVARTEHSGLLRVTAPMGQRRLTFVD